MSFFDEKLISCASCECCDDLLNVCKVEDEKVPRFHGGVYVSLWRRVVRLFPTLFLLVGVSGCIDNSMLPDLIRLPFEGCLVGFANNSESPAKPTEGLFIIEVEGSCDGYATGSRWIECYEEKVEPISTLLGAGSGPDGQASTDSRPCLRYELPAAQVDEFIAIIVECAAATGMWRVYFNRRTSLTQFECFYLWP